jgi:hypothetical protein
MGAGVDAARAIGEALDTWAVQKVFVTDPNQIQLADA